MCLETTTSYKKCSATFTHTILCLPYIADETCKSLCPQFKSRVNEYEGGGCGCKTDGGRCMFFERDGERSWAFMAEHNEIESAREAREYGEMMEREGKGREKREYRRLLERKDDEVEVEMEVEVEDIAMDGVDGEGGEDGKLRAMKDQCRVRLRALDRAQIVRLEELEKVQRARLEKAKLEQEELDRKNRDPLVKDKLRREKLEEHRKMQTRIQNANLEEHEQQVVLSRKKLRAAELEKMKAIRDQDSGARDSWTAEQWAAEARLCHRLDKGKQRITRWQKWEKKAAKAHEEGDPRDKHRIIVEWAEEYFFQMKGMENFYREKAQLPLEKPGHFELLGPRRRLKKPSKAMRRNQHAADIANLMPEHKPSMMLDFGADWGQSIPELMKDEQMEVDENEPEKYVVDEDGVIDLTG